MRSAVIKDALRNAFPNPIAYAAHLKALFQNEVELRLLPWLCDRNKLAIDVGAFTGTYTVGLSIYAKSVIAVEPQPRQAAELRRSMPKSVKVIEVALSSRNGDARMMLPSPGGGSMSRLDTSGPSTEGWTEMSVRTRRLDDLGGEEHVGFIKIDAEGHEREVLRGARRTLVGDRPNLLIEIEERHGANAVNVVVGFLKEFGYDAFFARRNKIHRIEAFDATRDQNPKLLIDDKRRAYADYINNFIFIHHESKNGLPESVPPPTRALCATIAAQCGVGSR